MTDPIDIPAEVNGAAVVMHADPLTALADVLRDELGLTGTKLGCRAGDCGSCTVLVDDVPVTSCLVPVARVRERSVVTIEGLARDQRYARIFDAFRSHNASQCGFCIPGIIMASTALLESRQDTAQHPPRPADIDAGLSGNLCRCTGYEAIVAAITEAAAAEDRTSNAGDNAGSNLGNNSGNDVGAIA